MKRLISLLFLLLGSTLFGVQYDFSLRAGYGKNKWHELDGNSFLGATEFFVRPVKLIGLGIAGELGYSLYSWPREGVFRERNFEEYAIRTGLLGKLGSSFYIGGGLLWDFLFGYCYWEPDKEIFANTSYLIWEWRAFAGVEYHFSPSFGILIESTFRGSPMLEDFRNYNINIGLAWHFGVPKHVVKLIASAEIENEIIQPGKKGNIKLTIQNKSKHSAKEIEILLTSSSEYENYILFSPIKIEEIKSWEIKSIGIPIQVSLDAPEGEATIYITGTERGKTAFSSHLNIRIEKEKKDALSPVISVLTPQDGSRLNISKTNVKGVVVDNVKIEKVYVNQEEVKRTRGIAVVPKAGFDVQDKFEFSVEMELALGLNHITVTAYDKAGNKSEKVVSVEYSTVTITSPSLSSSMPSLWAVVVGINDYRDPRISDLKYADADAKAFYLFMKEQKEKGVFEDIRIRFLLNKEATLKGFRSALGDFLLDARADDIVIIYFAGHGTTDKVGKPYLLTYDSNIDELYATALPMSEFNDLLKERIYSERTLVIADACHSGGIGTEFRGTPDVYSEFYGLIRNTKGKAILTASRAKELSKEDKNLGHGVFTYYLLEGLKGKADANDDDIITLSELYDYLWEKVKVSTNGAQHPELKGNYDNQMPLSVIKE